MKIFLLPLALIFSISTGQVFALDWDGNADCPSSKDKNIQEKNEQIENSKK